MIAATWHAHKPYRKLGQSSLSNILPSCRNFPPTLEKGKTGRKLKAKKVGLVKN